MKRAIFINWLLASIVAILMVLLFYLTQKNYDLLNKSNQDVIETNALITSHQNVSNDFKNAIIYISTYKNSPSQAYVDTYGKGIWEKYYDILRLKRLVSNAEKQQLDIILKQIDIEENWLSTSNPEDILLSEDRDKILKALLAYSAFLTTKEHN